MAPYNPPDAHYSEVTVDSEEKATKLLHSGGKMLYNLTKKLKLKYIWYDNERRVLELWGPYYAFASGAEAKLMKKLESL